MIYYRLHGSPKMYHSSYDEAYLDGLDGDITEWQGSASVWCIFDNTASGAAVGNALSLEGRLTKGLLGKSPNKEI